MLKFIFTVAIYSDASHVLRTSCHCILSLLCIDRSMSTLVAQSNVFYYCEILLNRFYSTQVSSMYLWKEQRIYLKRASYLIVLFRRLFVNKSTLLRNRYTLWNLMTSHYRQHLTYNHVILSSNAFHCKLLSE